MRDEVTAELLDRGRTALRLGLIALVLSTLAYYALGCVVGMNARGEKSLFSLADDRWELSECLYASAITVSTVGYGDVLGTDRCEEWADAEDRRAWVSATDAHEEPGFDWETATLATDWSLLTRLVTGLQVVVGMAFFLYVVAQLTTFFTEGGHAHLASTLRARRLLGRMQDHVVVCGLEDASKRAVEALVAAGVPCAVVDEDSEAIHAYRREHRDVVCMAADATSEETLSALHLVHARALLCLLPDDGMNLVTLFTARGLAPEVHVVCRGLRPWSTQRLAAAGADTVVGIESLAGLRAASELVRPTVVDFLDRMVRADADVHFEGLTVRLGMGAIRLAELDLPGRAGLHAVALRASGAEAFDYNPGPSARVRDGDELVFLGTAEQVARARKVLQVRPEPTGAVETQPATVEIGTDADQGDAGARTERIDHFIVCGAGLVGVPIARELLASERPLVLVDRDPARSAELGLDLPADSLLERDALDPLALREAGIQRARGLVTALPSDRDNLVVVVTALQMRPDLRVVAVARAERARARLERAGALVVALDSIAGNRIAADVLRPHAATFLDRMRAAPGATRVEAVRVAESSEAVGFTLADLRVFERTGMRVLALRRVGRSDFEVNPGGATRLDAGAVLVVVGSPSQVRALARLVGDVE